ncbi:MAG: hypothetical protein ACXACU_12925, partial [Candidatus Hodarchaeales archaeon]
MKVTCQATCSKCYHEKGRRQDLDVNDQVWHCNSCNKVYLCDIGLARLGTNYSCPFDNTIVIKEEVDKSIIKKEGIPGTEKQHTGEMYHKLKGWKEKKKVKTSKYSLRASKSLSAFHRSKISELNDIDHLTIPLLKEIAKIPLFKIEITKKFTKIKSKKEFLELLG